MKSSLIKDGFLSLLWRGGSVAANFIIAVVISRTLGPELRGVYDLFFVSFLFVSVVGTTGIENSMLRMIGRKAKEFNVAFANSLYITILMYCVFLLTLFIYIAVYENSDLFLLFSGLLLGFMSSINTLFRHYFLGHKKIRFYNYSTTLEPIVFLIVLVAISTIYDSISLPLIIRCYCFSISILVCVNLFLYSNIDSRNRWGLSLSTCYSLLSEGFKFFLTGLVSFLHGRSNIFILNYFGGLAAVGRFTTANKLAQFFIKIPNELSIVLFSYASADTSQAVDKQEHKARTFIVFLKWLFILPLLLLVFVFSFFMEDLIELVFGEEFKNLGLVGSFLLGSSILGGGIVLISNYLNGKGYIKYSMILSILSLVSVLVFALLLVPFYNSLGLALALLITNCIGFLFILSRFNLVYNMTISDLVNFRLKELRLIINRFKK